MQLLLTFLSSYKQDVKLRLVTEELGFESDGHAASFIIDQAGLEIGQTLLQTRGDDIFFLTAKAYIGQIFEGPRKLASKKVDIKGQI